MAQHLLFRMVLKRTVITFQIILKILRQKFEDRDFNDAPVVSTSEVRMTAMLSNARE
jgi:hypothetical protein